MALSTAVVSVTDDRNTFAMGQKFAVIGTIAIGASPLTYAAGGIVMSLFGALIKASRTPDMVIVQGQSGYVYVYVPGSDGSNGLLKVFQQSAATSALTEVPTAAVPAGVSGDTITFLAIFKGME
jgi:hypothetical protein